MLWNSYVLGLRRREAMGRWATSVFIPVQGTEPSTPSLSADEPVEMVGLPAEGTAS
jgi:hypothetical protein